MELPCLVLAVSCHLTWQYNEITNNRQLLTELLVIAQATDAVLKPTPPSFAIVRSAVEKPALWAGPRVTDLLTPPS